MLCCVDKTGWLVDPECRPSFTELAEEFAKMARDPGRYLLIEVALLCTNVTFVVMASFTACEYLIL